MPGLFIDKAHACGLMILMGAHVEREFSAETIIAAKKFLRERGFTYGLCEHCHEPWWLSPVPCHCCGRIANDAGGSVFMRRNCVKKLCGNCQTFYPLTHLKALFRYAEQERLSIAQVLR